MNENSRRIEQIKVENIVWIIYLYFTYDNYEDYKSLGINDSIKRKRLTELSLFASSLVLISGLIFLYISIVDTELEIELAFN